MRLTLACLLILAQAAPAHALSCMMPDIPWSYEFYNDLPERYGVFAGVISFADTPPVISGYDEAVQSPLSAPFYFSGEQILATGTRQLDQVPLTIQLSCAGPWCPGFPQQTWADVLGFIEVDAAGAPMTLHISACGGSTFEDTPAARDQIRACMNGGQCSPVY